MSCSSLQCYHVNVSVSTINSLASDDRCDSAYAYASKQVRTSATGVGRGREKGHGNEFTYAAQSGTQITGKQVLCSLILGFIRVDIQKRNCSLNEKSKALTNSE